jgi:MoaA/NifB/PqqE/SkfB family radical SAM enzyme
MDVADYARVARESMALGAVNFSFQGGEPLLFKNLGAIITACRPNMNVISVTTNGTLLTLDRIAELKRIGVDILTVSLDSGDPAEHDRFRGASGVFDKTLKGVHLALREGLNVTLGTVVTHQSVHSDGLARLIDLALELRVLLYFILPVAAGNWAGRDDMVLTAEDWAHIEGLTHRSPYLRTDFQANLGGYGCGAAKEILYLTPYGDVLTCPFLHIAPGNIFNESLAVIRERAMRNPYFSSYHDKCLVSTDHEFIDRYLSKTQQASRLPMDWDEAFAAEPLESPQ